MFEMKSVMGVSEPGLHQSKITFMSDFIFVDQGG